MDPPHFLIVAFPSQSNVSPAVQLALRLIRFGATVTLATTISTYKRMEKAAASAASTGKIVASNSLPPGLRLATYSDGVLDDESEEENNKKAVAHDHENFMASMRQKGIESLSDLIERTKRSKNGGFDCVIYSMILAWVAEVAREHNLPSTIMWVQTAAMLDICYNYFQGGYGDAIRNACLTSSSVNIPGIPTPLGAGDIPTFLSPLKNHHAFLFPLVQEQFDVIERETQADERVNILMNTFDELELETLKALPVKFNVSTVGPLLPTAILKGQDEDNNKGDDFRVDMFGVRSNEYIKWLDSMEESSVVYVSFGSLAVPTTEQIKGLASALVECGRPFLWVIRPSGTEDVKSSSTDDQVIKGQGEEDIQQEMISWLKKQQGGMNKGMVLSWCSQLAVLTHKAVGCFVTHCGWNSSLESLTCGVPVVGIPQGADQVTNARLLEDVWKVGLRARPKDDNKEVGGRLVAEMEEIKRCIEEVMQSEEMRNNAQKWKKLAIQAATSSETKLKQFVDEVVGFKGKGKGATTGHVTKLQ